MLELSIFSMTWRDALDIGLVSFLLYYAIRFVRGTRAIAALNGLLLLLAVYFLAQVLGLYTMVWLLENVFNSLFLIVVILFHEDIRQALATVSLRSWFKRKQNASEHLVKTLSETSAQLAAKKIGALIVLERTMPLGDMTSKGVKINADLSSDLLMTIFFPNTALHDGAVIIDRNGKLAAAGCVLPLAQVARQHFGTRHRAAIGLSEVSDALVIVISEERGEITVAQQGHLSNPLNQERLERILSHGLSN